jgi:hypothetical protein
MEEMTSQTFYLLAVMAFAVLIFFPSFFLPRATSAAARQGAGDLWPG